MSQPTNTAIHRRVAALRAGTDPTCIARLASGWAVFGEQQFLRGYALLLPDPVVGTLNDLRGAARAVFLGDMASLGDAVLGATGALRVNYAMFGNVEPALHAHVVPRYRDEDPVLATAHPWQYDWSAAPCFDASREAALLAEVRRLLGVGE
ncbi:MAG: hypothetical protein RLZZ393_1025 [Pseudomonadota bacterium]